MSDISPSRLDNNAEFLGALEEVAKENAERGLGSAALIEAVKQARDEAVVNDGSHVRGWINPDELIPTNTPQPKQFITMVTKPDGTTEPIEGDTELESLQKANAYYRSLRSGETPAAAAQPAKPQLSVEEQRAAVEEAEIRLKLMRGELSPETALDTYLSSRGIDIQEIQNKQVEQSWATAVDAFKERHADWEGGTANLESMMKALEELGLADSPSVASLEQAFQHIADHGRYYENPQLAEQRSIASARDFESIKNAALRCVGRDPNADYASRDWYKNG
jgi:hypothetical protein